jgi:organic hydroperoxide reductase OsmC/OhrA
MSGAHRYTATVRWQRNGAAFSDRRYSRAHVLAFDGGIEVPGSPSPLHVRAPYSQEHAVDPEEAFTASISSCHMLFFLEYAAQAGFVVDSYADTAVATLGRNAAGKEYLATVVLAPKVAFSGERLPDTAEIAELHERAHHDCFIANSIRTEVTVEAQD